MLLFFAVMPGLLGGCGKEQQQSSGREKEEIPLPVERIVSVESNADASGNVVLLVPRRAVFHQGELAGVYAVGNDGHISVRWVRPGRIEGESRVILGGLDAGEEIVGSFNAPLREGARVKQQVSVIKEVQSNE